MYAFSDDFGPGVKISRFVIFRSGVDTARSSMSEDASRARMLVRFGSAIGAAYVDARMHDAIASENLMVIDLY